MAARDQLGQLGDHLLADLHLLGLTVEGDHVPAQEDLCVEVPLERAQHGVLGAGQLRGDSRIEGDLLPHCSLARTSSLTRLPSARPAALDITDDITLPISRCGSAPVSATAPSTSPSSSCSEISSGRYPSISSTSNSSAA